MILALAIGGLISLPHPAHSDRSEARHLFRQGVIAASAGELKLARSKLTEAILADPDYLEAYSTAIPLWIEAGEHAELTKYLELATTRHRDFAFAWYTLGYVYRLNGRYKLAVLAYEAYLQLRPGDPDPRFGLGLSLLELGKPRRATLELQRYLVLEHRPEREKFVAEARRLIVELGGVVPKPSRDTSSAAELRRAAQLVAGLRFASALAVLEGVEPSERADRGELWLLRARAHIGAGRPEAAIAAGFVALGYRGGDHATLTALADAFDAVGSQGAVSSYLRSLAMPAR